MAPQTSRRMIAALQISLDGFTQGANGDQDWVDSWADALQLIPNVDTFVLGGRMYADYGEYWEAILADPKRIQPVHERPPSRTEIAYARLAAKTPHVVLSTTLDRVSWPQARIVRNVGALRALKDQPGKTIYVVGGATLVRSLLDEDLIDELRLIVHPVLLGDGKALFAGVKPRSLHFVQAEPTESGRVILTYRA